MFTTNYSPFISIFKVCTGLGSTNFVAVLCQKFHFSRQESVHRFTPASSSSSYPGGNGIVIHKIFKLMFKVVRRHSLLVNSARQRFSLSNDSTHFIPPYPTCVRNKWEEGPPETSGVAGRWWWINDIRCCLRPL